MRWAGQRRPRGLSCGPTRDLNSAGEVVLVEAVQGVPGVQEAEEAEALAGGRQGYP